MTRRLVGLTVPLLAMRGSNEDRQAKLTGARVAELLGSMQPVDGLMEESGDGEEEDAALYLAPGACVSCYV